MQNSLYHALWFSLLASCTGNNNKPILAQSETHPLGFHVEFDSSLNSPRRSPPRTDDSLIMTAAGNTDFFIEPGGAYEKSDAPLLLKRVDNRRPFTFVAELRPEHHVKYDAGMIFIFVDLKHWFKFAFEADENMNPRLVTVRTAGVSDDNNHEVFRDSTVYLKISSDTKSIGFYYSADGMKWNLVRVFKNDYPLSLYLGIGTQSPAGTGNKTVFYGAMLTDSAVRDFRSGI
ncbi:MAG TPA: DUF1349 domain-containing protein [Puia sp.]|nr:DUF1349 domain-containing protein [Puia sp.]